MRIATTRDLALYLRERRRDLGKSQSEIAAAAGVSRRWLSALEAGKPTAEVGLVLRTMHALDLVVTVQPRSAVDSGIDLDELLRKLGEDDD